MIFSDESKRKRVLLATMILVCIAAIPLILIRINNGKIPSGEGVVTGTVVSDTEIVAPLETTTAVPVPTTIKKYVMDADHTDSSIGTTFIAKWKGDKLAAFTLSFDDSMVSQADVAVPALLDRSLVGTWFVNPGKEHYQLRQEVWEQTIPDTGNELANHTMNHEGARDFEEAEYEIGETARIIWSLKPPGSSKFLSFASGGATSWAISKEEWLILYDKYHLVERTGSKSMAGASAEDMIAQAKGALEQGTWSKVHFHGIGGEWIPVETQEFLNFLDYLVSATGDLWIGTYGSVYKYIQERDTAEVTQIEVSDKVIRLDLTSDMPLELYDQPLTLITEVPTQWAYCEVTQAGQMIRHEVLEGFVQYEAVPGLGKITLVQGS